jgi:hypothetical protein
MATHATMTFRRDVSDHKACLEYSWIPEGIRHHIELMPGEHEGHETDSVSAGVNVSKVQVYVLNNNERVSFETEHFPDALPPDAPLDHAAVEVYEKNLEVVCTAYYANGHSIEDKHKLASVARPCPQPLT